MNRRGFLGAILATAVAPAIVRASSLMPVVARNPLQELADYARRMGIEPITENGEEVYVAFMHPKMAEHLWRQARNNAFVSRFAGQVGRVDGVRIITVPSSIHPQDGRITVAPPNPVLALRQQLRMRAG